MKRPTKKAIQTVLRTMDVTAIHHIAHLSGVDVREKARVKEFIYEFAPTNKVRKQAYLLSYGRSYSKDTRRCYKRLDAPISNVICHAKQQVKEGYSSYTKILIEGNNNIYWTSPIYGHSDYNKSIAMPNTEKNRQLMEVVNKFMKNHFKI